MAAKRSSSPSETVTAAPDYWGGMRLGRVLIGLLFYVAGGMFLRAYLGSHAAVEHFDEGVYASNLWFGAGDGYTYPMRWFYAPPLLPWVIENLFLIGGASNGLALLPGFLAGGVTIGLVWYAGGRWISPAAGATAMMLAIFSEYHGAFSGTALTDVPLGMWMLGSLVAFGEGCRRKSIPWGIVAGVLCGCAWLTKYNGWLCLPIALGGLTVGAILSPEWRRREPWIVWGAMLLATVLVWSPYLWSLQTVGGYAAITAHHRGYFVGGGGWWKSFLQQKENLRYFDGLLSAWIMVILGVFVQQRLSVLGFTWNAAWPVTAKGEAKSRDVRMLLVAGVLALVGIVTGVSALVFGLGLFWLVRLVGDYRRGKLTPDQILGGGIVGVWFVGLTVLTPLYTPYPRLVIPWMLGAWLAGAGGFVTLLSGIKGEAPVRRMTAWLAGILLGTFGLSFAVALGVLMAGGWDLLRPNIPQRESELKIAESLMREVLTPEGEGKNRSGREAVIVVYGDPALFFQIRLAGFRNTMTQGSLGLLEQPWPPGGPQTYLIVGGESAEDPQVLQQLEKAQPRLRRVRAYPIAPSDLVLLDRYSPAQLKATPKLRERHVLVYELVP